MNSQRTLPNVEVFGLVRHFVPFLHLNLDLCPGGMSNSTDNLI